MPTGTVLESTSCSIGTISPRFAAPFPLDCAFISGQALFASLAPIRQDRLSSTLVLPPRFVACRREGTCSGAQHPTNMSSKVNFMRTRLCACAGTQQQVSQLIDQLNKGQLDNSIEVVIAPTFIHLPHVLGSADSRYEVGAQNCWTSGTGAFTGEVRPLPALIAA